MKMMFKLAWKSEVHILYPKNGTKDIKFFFHVWLSATGPIEQDERRKEV